MNTNNNNENNDKRFIEEIFPVKEVSVISAKEKNIRHGHISTLHIWWSRKPLASSRVINYAALIPAPKNKKEVEEKKKFIIDFAKWENSLREDLIEKARKDILEANGGVPPKVLDPFGGGGSIPLEALRLGCETYSMDYNPVAVLIQKCTLEYPQKYGNADGNKLRGGFRLNKSANKNEKNLLSDLKDDYTIKDENPLLEDVKYWGNWVLEEAKKEIGKFYPVEKDGSIPVGFIWSRTINCQNPACGAEIPLRIQYWLAKKSNKKVSLLPYVKKKSVEFKIVGTGYEPMPTDFDPEDGTIARAKAKCLVCGAVVDDKTTRKLFQQGKSSERMIAVVLHKPGQSGKTYRIATENDMKIFEEAEKYLEQKRKKLMDEWGIDPVPDELLPPKETLGFRVQRYNLLKWGDLFNSRQKLALITFTEKVKDAYKMMIENGYDEEYGKAIISYLSFGISRLSTYLANLVRWRSDVLSFERIFDRQALGMVWDYGEVSSFSDSRGCWDISSILEVIINNAYLNLCSKVNHSSATSLSFNDNYFDTVFTDPPYYDNVPYSYLSDFFYVWLKRSVGDLYPELFSTPLTPKTQEIVAYSHLEGGFEAGKKFFEENLKKSFKEIHRVLKPNGITVIVYAHKSTEGWETLINSLLDSGLVITAAWPINTEMESRLRANESAALASSIYIVARKIDRQPTAFYNNVKEELATYLTKRLDNLWEEGISGADFFISAIGSAIEVFGKYESVMDYEGNIIRADKLLEDVRVIVTNYAVKKILHNGFASKISDLTRFYVLCRWEFKSAKIPFDEANKIARSCHLELADYFGKKTFIKKEKEFISILGPHDREIEDLEGSEELIDVLHHAVKLWEKSKRRELQKLLNETGFAKNDSFYRVAQAIAETLPAESKEKRALEGFLNLREKIIQDSVDDKDKGLFD